MPLGEVIAQIDEAEPSSDGNAPEEMNAPTDVPSPSTMDTPPMLPPYIHNQTLDDRSLLVIGGSALTMVGVLERLL